MLKVRGAAFDHFDWEGQKCVRKNLIAEICLADWRERKQTKEKSAADNLKDVDNDTTAVTVALSAWVGGGGGGER